MAQNDFELLVLGAGMAGFAAIQKAATLGARAAIVEKGQVGGT
jgi:glutathione reductase (NADPH)